MAELQVLNGPLQWKTIKVSGSRFLVGRKTGCHLVLKDGWVSREHSVVIETGTGEFVVQDLDSENGIYVNGSRVTESPLRHADILRIGRTEMRFFNPGENTGESEAPSGLAHEGPLAVAGQGPDSVDSLEMTVLEPGALRRPKTDPRDRIRRLERQLNETEEENRLLAAETAVFKRALAQNGLLDPTTGQLRLDRLTSSNDEKQNARALLPIVWNPLSRVVFPMPNGEVLRPDVQSGTPDLAVGILKLGLIGAGAAGARIVDAFHRIGYNRAVAFSGHGEALDELSLSPRHRVHVEEAKDRTSLRDIERVLAEFGIHLESVFSSCLGPDRSLFLVAAGLGGVTGLGSVNPVLELLREFGEVTGGAEAAVPTGLILAVPNPGEVDDGARREALREGGELARRLFDAGRLSPFVVIDHGRLGFVGGDPEEARAGWNATMAGAVDAVNRLPLLSSLRGDMDEAKVRESLLGPGVSSFGLAATEEVTDAGLGSALRHALSDGWLCGSVPPSRGRRALVLTMIGSEVLAGEGALLNRLESNVEQVREILPQADVSTGFYEDCGVGVRMIAWVGGLPFPENLGPSDN